LFERVASHKAWGDLEYVDGIIARTGVTLPPDDYGARFFVHAVNMLNAILEESAVGRIYCCEELAKNAETLGDFVEEITRGKVSPGSQWLHCVLQLPRVNGHAFQPRRFSDWEADVIRRVVQPRAWELYQELGYPPVDFDSLSGVKQPDPESARVLSATAEFAQQAAG